MIPADVTRSSTQSNSRLKNHSCAELLANRMRTSAVTQQLDTMRPTYMRLSVALGRSLLILYACAVCSAVSNSSRQTKMAPQWLPRTPKKPVVLNVRSNEGPGATPFRQRV